ncbi:MAG: T9SS type A sorting domain-containing protein [Bacteroidia bacterium]|nr:T9SS type A sorting domain-containing protein [Bacteroidia bacterium]
MKSNSIMASDMGFKYMGGSTYRLSIKIYRNCLGDSLKTNLDSAFWFVGNNGNRSSALNYLKLTRISIVDVSNVCSSTSSGCNPANTTGSGSGVEEHVYIADLDLSNSIFTTLGLGSSLCELNVIFKSCCRNPEITTGSHGETFFTQASLNICNLNKCKSNINSTSDFYSKPIIYAYCNMGVFYNSVATDTNDFDSLSFKLVKPLKGLKSEATLAAPFSYLKPLTPYCLPAGVNCTPNIKTNPTRGFFFDTSNCNIAFTPTQCDESSVFAIAVQEFRKDSLGNWVNISTISREMQCIVAIMAPNNPPTITGPTVNKVCEGDKICFDIKGTDATYTPYQTIPDTVQMNWNGGIPGGTFTIKNPKDREKTAQFCWQTQIGDGSPVAYSFAVTATDDHCPNPLQSTRSFKVLVMAKPAASRSYHCLDSGRLEMKSNVTKDFVGTPIYKWSVRDSIGNNESFYSTKMLDTAKLKMGEKYIIVHTINNSSNCPVIYQDTVVCYDQVNSIFNAKIIPFVVSPNPLQVGDKFDLPQGFKGQVEWCTIDGKLVFSNAQNPQNGIVPQLAPGFYLIELIDSETKRVAKVLVK